MQLRKDILREQMLKVESISNLLNELRKSEGRRMKKEDVVEYLSSSMRSLHPDSLFNVLLNWARYAELLRYDADEQEIYLVE
ncbi:MAG: AAA-associated domain-containing protein [Thermoplasmata archaeon]|nr:AAA-associated domain-containing protein [Candidatus Sysuiplasma acidicola]